MSSLAKPTPVALTSSMVISKSSSSSAAALFSAGWFDIAISFDGGPGVALTARAVQRGGLNGSLCDRRACGYGVQPLWRSVRVAHFAGGLWVLGRSSCWVRVFQYFFLSVVAF